MSTETVVETAQTLPIASSALRKLQAKVQQAQADLEYAQAVITAMETSKFWKLRSLWFRFASLIGLSPTDSVLNPPVPIQTVEPAPTPHRLQPLVTQLPNILYFDEEPSLFGMTSLKEQQYLHNYAAAEYSGVGEIVELGCFFGSLTISLAKGLAENSTVAEKTARIHAHDLFVCDEYAADHFLAKTAYKAGDSFLKEYLSRISAYQSYIQVHPCDLTQTTWSGGAIEFLLIDAMKSAELGTAITRHFFPFLIPGRSIVMHQDFSHFYTYWIHLIMYRLRDYFEPLYHIPTSSVIYRYCKEIPASLLQVEHTLESFSVEEIEAAFDYSLSLVADEMQANVVGAYVVALVLSGHAAQGKIVFDRAIEYGLDAETSELGCAKPYLDYHFPCSEPKNSSVNHDQALAEVLLSSLS